MADFLRCCFSKVLVIATKNQSLKRSGMKVDMNTNGLAKAPTHILIRAAEASKHDPKVQADSKAFHRRLRELAILAIAAI